MPKFQIIRTQIMQEFESEEEADNIFEEIWKANRDKIKIADFQKKEIHLIDKSILKIIEVKN